METNGPSSWSVPAEVGDPFGEFSEEILSSLCDPITLELMVDPVVTVDGITYERESIEEWFQVCRRRSKPITSPTTNQPLASDDLRSNLIVKSVSDAVMKLFKSQNELELLGEKEKAVLRRFAALEERNNEKLRLQAEEQARIAAMNVCCPNNHHMQMYKRESVPSVYRQRRQNPTINCDGCRRERINTYLEYYFHCQDCANYDLCQDCANAKHEGRPFRPVPPAPRNVRSVEEALRLVQERVEQLANRQAAIPVPIPAPLFVPLNSRRCRAGHTMRRLSHVQPYSDEGQNIVCRTCSRHDLLLANAFYHCHECREDRCLICAGEERDPLQATAVAADLAPPVVVTNTHSRPILPRVVEEFSAAALRRQRDGTPVSAVCLCPRDHPMSMLTQTRPPEYRGSPRCNACRKTELDTDESGYYHCTPCGYDLCIGCHDYLRLLDAPESVCRQNHSMELYRLTLPAGYTSVTCDSCRTNLLERDPAGYLHCHACWFDRCARCTRSSFPPRQAQAAPAPPPPSIPIAQPVIHGPAAEPPPETTGTCRRGHPLAFQLRTLPALYTSANCDGCGARRLQDDAQGFHHCGVCRYDLCHNCHVNVTALEQAPRHNCLNQHQMRGMIRSTPSRLSRNITCDGCRAPHIQTRYAGYLHCDRCNFDLCATCANTVPTGPVPAPAPESRGLLHRLTAPFTTLSVAATPAPPAPTTTATSTATSNTVYCPRGHHPMRPVSSLGSPPSESGVYTCDGGCGARSGRGRYLDNGQRCIVCNYDLCAHCLTGIAALEQLPQSTCPQGHRLNGVIGGSTGSFDSMRCDQCQTGHIERHNGGYLHCEPCGYDVCQRCARQPSRGR